MIVEVGVRRVADGWTVALKTPGWEPPARELRAGKRRFPHPPAGEAAWDRHGTTLAEDLDDGEVERLHRRMVLGTPDGDDVGRFGAYLGAVLLGPWWDRVTGDCPQGPLKLQIDMAVDDFRFQGLPWEMMARNDVPLAALPDVNRRVAISRVIQPTIAPQSTPIELPLRVLFVVGAEVDDALRPGAEYLALLRQFRMPVANVLAGMDRDSHGTALRTRLVLQASRDALQDAIDQFQPAVVHLIAHGRWSANGPLLVLTEEQGGTLREDEVPAETLSRLLRGRTGAAPPVQAVVVNACHTGEPDPTAASMAAQLVDGGIPMAVGMSGEVADGTCRIFTRAFYRAMVEAKDIEVACAEGRRAALLFNPAAYRQSVEWTRPSLCRAAGVSPVFTLNATHSARARAAENFRDRGDQALCGRMRLLQAFHGLCASARGGGPPGLMFEVASQGTPSRFRTPFQLGKSWLLNEFAAQAILDGFAPCLLPSNESSEIPSSLILLAISLAERMNVTRINFGREKRDRSHAYQLSFDLLGIDVATIPGGYRRAIIVAKQELRKSGAPILDISMFLNTIQDDLADLASDLDIAPPGTPMILIDDLHRYEGVAVPLLEELGAYGLGTSHLPVPLVCTYAVHGTGVGEKILPVLKGREGRFKRIELGRFEKPSESLLAYRQYLTSLHYTPSMLPQQSEKVKLMLQRIENAVEGIPSRFFDLDLMLEADASNDVVIKANDDEILARRRGQDGY